MELEAYFSGCNCGCTPSTTFKIEGETREELIRGLARLFSEHATYDKKPENKYRKISVCENDLNVKDVDVYDQALELDSLRDDLKKLRNLQDISFIPPYICQSGYAFTKEQKQINKSTKIQFDKEIELRKEEIQSKQAYIDKKFNIYYTNTYFGDDE